ncbi:hypothetical protein ACXVUM_13435 [Williamsia sp. SKLECPSW1]
MGRRTCFAVVLGLAVVAAAGCSSSTSTPARSATSSSAPSSSAAFVPPLTQFVLQERDMPAGFVVMPLSDDQRSSAVSAVTGAAPGTTVTPSRCQPDPTLVPEPTLSLHAVSAFADKASELLVTSTASRQGPRSAVFARYDVDGCGTRTVTSSAGTTTITAKRVPIVIRGVTDPVVIEQTSSTPLAGFPPSTTRALTAVFDVKGVTVTLSQRPLTAATPLNRVAFQALVRVAAAQAMGT